MSVGIVGSMLSREAKAGLITWTEVEVLDDAEAIPDQMLPRWIRAHVNELEFFGGSPKVFVPDNLESAVTEACRYEPKVQRAYGPELGRLAFDERLGLLVGTGGPNVNDNKVTRNPE